MRPRRSDDHGGVRVTARPRRGRGARWAALAVVVLAGIVVGSRLAERRAAQADAGPPPGDPATATSSATAATAQPVARRTPGGRSIAGIGRDGEDATPDLSDYVLPGEAPTMRQVIDALHARGIRTGLGAFPPPGTSPPLRGLAVPDDFVLPPGYVRHHQATDDGQSIPPILMFSPDIDSIEVRGVRVPIPPDRLVTPELAPAGLPLRWIDIPPPRDAGAPP